MERSLFRNKNVVNKNLAKDFILGTYQGSGNKYVWYWREIQCERICVSLYLSRVKQ